METVNIDISLATYERILAVAKRLGLSINDAIIFLLKKVI